jgi:glycosyltransferase involved in cell wall biosynthesis
MRIVHVANNAAPQFGGAYRSIALFRAAASTRNYATECITFDDDPAANPHLNDGGGWLVIPTLRGTFGTRYGLVSARAAAKLTDRMESADVIVIHLLYRYHATWAAKCARDFNKQLIIVPHGSLDPYVFTYRAVRKKVWLRFHHRLLFRNSLVLYATDREREKAAAAVGNLRSTSLFWPMDAEACHFADRLRRTPAAPRRLLLVGRLHPMKRVLETVRAFCRARVPGWQLVVIGAETGEISLKDLQMAAGAEWNRSVMYRGVLDRQTLYSEYRCASALILASHRENFGHVVAEAMRFGLPVMISEDVDLCTLVRQARAGLVVPIHSENDILNGLASFLRQAPDEFEALGRSAQTAAKEHFDFRTFADSYNTLMETLLSQGAK